MFDLSKDVARKVVYRTEDSSFSDDDKATLNSSNLNTEEVLNELKRLFHKEKMYSKAKFRAYKAMLELKSIDIVGTLLDIFPRAPIDWKGTICTELEAFPEPRTIAAMIDVLLTAKNPNVRYSAAETLGIIGDASAVVALEYAMKHDQGRDYEGYPVAEEAKDALQKVQKRLSRFA